jgi:hypothetical protein
LEAKSLLEQQSRSVKSSLPTKEASSEVLSTEEEEFESSSQDAQPVAKKSPVGPVVAAKVVSAPVQAAASGSEDESGEFSTSLSEDDDGDDVGNGDLRSFLLEHELIHLFKTLDSKTNLQALKAMNLVSVRGLGLSYADSSNLATALGIKVVH